jgi:hypothetical protein
MIIYYSSFASSIFRKILVRYAYCGYEYLLYSTVDLMKASAATRYRYSTVLYSTVAAEGCVLLQASTTVHTESYVNDFTYSCVRSPYFQFWKSKFQSSGIPIPPFSVIFVRIRRRHLLYYHQYIINKNIRQQRKENEI